MAFSNFKLFTEERHDTHHSIPSNSLSMTMPYTCSTAVFRMVAHGISCVKSCGKPTLKPLTRIFVYVNLFQPHPPPEMHGCRICSLYLIHDLPCSPTQMFCPSFLPTDLLYFPLKGKHQLCHSRPLKHNDSYNRVQAPWMVIQQCSSTHGLPARRT